jgi:hypothetical protein
MEMELLKKNGNGALNKNGNEALKKKWKWISL